MSSISRPHKARLGHVHYNSDSEVSGRGCWVVRKLDANSAMCSWVGLLYTFTGLALASKFTISSKSKEAEGSWLVQLPPVLEKYLEKYLTSPVLKTPVLLVCNSTCLLPKFMFEPSECLSAGQLGTVPRSLCITIQGWLMPATIPSMQ